MTMTTIHVPSSFRWLVDMGGAYVIYTRDQEGDTLSMPAKKIYDETPLQVLTDKPMRARVRRLSDVTGMSQAAVVREILKVGIPLMEDLWRIEGEVEPDGDEP